MLAPRPAEVLTEGYMAKSLRKQRAQRNGASSNRPNGRSGSRQGGFPLITIVVVVLALLVMLLPFSGVFDKVTSSTNPGAVPVPSAQQKQYPDIGQWKGLSQGMTTQQVRDLLGKPNVIEEYQGQVTWQYYENPELAGYFADAGGKRLRIKFENDRVVMYWKPQDAAKVIREHLEGQGQ